MVKEGLIWGRLKKTGDAQLRIVGITSHTPTVPDTDMVSRALRRRSQYTHWGEGEGETAYPPSEKMLNRRASAMFPGCVRSKVKIFRTFRATLELV